MVIDGVIRRNAKVRLIRDGVQRPDLGGEPLMPGFSDALSDAQLVALIAYLRAAFTEQPAWSDIGQSLRRAREFDADRLRAQHSKVAVINDVDPHRHAQLANDFAANVYIGIEARDQQVCEISYYHTEGFHSVAAHVFATLASEAIERSAPWFKPRVNGMRLQVLRETSMPAVVVGLGPITRVTPHSAVLADDLANALSIWVKTTSVKLEQK